jgi:hypothetical protein
MTFPHDPQSTTLLTNVIYLSPFAKSYEKSKCNMKQFFMNLLTSFADD